MTFQSKNIIFIKLCGIIKVIKTLIQPEGGEFKSMKLELISYESIGVLELGMENEDIVKALSIKPITFKKSEYECVDDFEVMHVYYEGGKSVGFEFFPPIEIIFKGINLSTGKIFQVTQVFLQLDENLKTDKYGFISYKYGFAIYGKEEYVDSIFVFKEGYYSTYINVTKLKANIY